jgi:nucleoside recognition membrane protein YjiH
MKKGLQNLIGIAGLAALIILVLALAWWGMKDEVFPPSPAEQEDTQLTERQAELEKAMKKGNLEFHPAEHWKTVEDENAR